MSKSHVGRIKKSIILMLLCLSFGGCYRYYTIPKEELTEVDSASYLIIVKTDSTTIFTDRHHQVFYRADEKEISIIKDSTKQNIPFNSVEKVKLRRFDYIMTCFTSAASLTATLLFFAIWVLHDFKIG